MKPIIRLTLLILISVSLVLLIASCGKPKQIGNTYEEPEITVEYLSTEYADQLIRDGATHILGTIEIITDENGNPFLQISEKEFVEETSHPDGYYIADKNLQVTYPLSYEARTTHLSGDTSIPNIMTSENFVKAVATDVKLSTSKNADAELIKLYDIYVIGEQVELILARYLP